MEELVHRFNTNLTQHLYNLIHFKKRRMNEKVMLMESQRVDATAYIFTTFELEMKNKEKKITEDDYQNTLTGSIDGDADAMYVVLKKHELTKELDITLAQIKALDYFLNLKKD